jgi:5-deoxy-glucuronate isomerase
VADLLLKAQRPQAGYTQLVSPGDGGLGYLGFGLANLGAGEKWAFETGGSEWVAVVLGGSIRAFGTKELTKGPLGSRAGVFGGKASAVYLPPGFKGRLEGVTAARVAVCQSLSEEGTGPTVIAPEDVRVKTVGVHNWEREVHDIVDKRLSAGKLLVGETFNRTGCWSSYPPHRHDEHRPPVEVNLEEVYHFQVDPPQGWGVQRVYTDDRRVEECYAVEQGDTVILPRGYHPVAAAPGYRVYYLWLMAGEGRDMAPFDDPAHAWIKGLETVVKETGGGA